MVEAYIGSPVRRREDVRFLTGKAKFVDDIKLPGMVHAAILRSPHAHARIVSIDTADALAIPGVVGVFSFKDTVAVSRTIPIRMYALPGLEKYLQHPLAHDKVRYVGEPVAVTIAENQYLVEDALEAIRVSYEPLPAVVDLREALRDEVLIHERCGTNLASQYTISIGDVESAFRQAEYTRREEFKIHRHTGNPLETRGLVAAYDPDREELTVWGATKVTYFNRRVLSSFLNLAEEKIHLIEPDVGGGFGIRGEFYPEDFLIPFAAIKFGRPVKWIEDRREHLLAANHSREVACDIEIATRRDGTLLALRASVYGDMGAYIRTHGGIVPASTAALLTGPYRFPNYECTVRSVMTNKMGLGTYRSPGRYESCFIRERLLDIAADELNLDPVEIRLKNLIQPGEMPYVVGVTRPGQSPTTFDSGNYPSALKTALEKFGYVDFKRLQGRYKDGKYHGLGIACYVKNTGRGPQECARVEIKAPNDVSVYLGIACLGQGHETTMAQICADSLGVPMDWITVFHGSTDFLPFGGGTFASRGTVMGGNAVHLAATQLKHKVLTFAGSHLEIPPERLELREGVIYMHGAELSRPLLNLSDLLALVEAKEKRPQESGFSETAYFKSDKLTYTYGAHVAHVTVEPETGEVKVERYLAVEDVGRCVNPLLLHGQVIGGIVQGIGATLFEELVYSEDGQLLTTTFRDYLLPASTVVPPIESIILEEAPSPLNPLGVKGGGEESIVGTGAALANAVANALKPLAVKVTELPLSQDRVRKLIKQSERSGPRT